MSSSYPPPPPNGAAGVVTPATPQSQQPPSQPLSPNQASVLASYDNGLSSPVDQTALEAAQAASLQALQAATAGTLSGLPTVPSPVTPGYAQLPSPHDPNASYLSADGDAAASTPGQAQGTKVTRLRRACDMCSQRKVKCDEAGPPCRPCRDLNVDCTFQREMKRRGPPNRHAEAARAAKRPRLEPNLSPTPHNAAETLVSIAEQSGDSALDAESIAPLPVLALLVDDFFTYIHPLAPFPHEPSFRQAFADREDRTNPEFLALLASMIGVLVASFPRTARLHLKTTHSTALFPRAILLIDRCRAVALDARGPRFGEKAEMSIYDAATSYFIGLAAGYTLQWNVCRRHMSECMVFIREMGYYRARDVGPNAFGVGWGGKPVDHIKDQIGKRIFWVMLLGLRSMVQLGAPHGDIPLPPPTSTEPYPDLPVEVDDQYISTDQILPQPDGTVSLITGFIQAINIYMTMNGLVSVEMAYGINNLDWHDQKTMLNDCLQAVKQVTEGMPAELFLELNPAGVPVPGSVEAGTSNTPSQHVFEDAPGYEYHPPAYPASQPPTDVRHVIESQPARRRQMQYEIQKANIYVSQLATRSYYVERFLNLRDAHREHARAQAARFESSAASASDPASAGAADGSGGASIDSKAVAAAAVQAAAEQAGADPIDVAMMAERELIVQNLLTVLASIPQRNMEPNGASLINKIRQVASTLLNDAPERKGPVAVKAEEYLGRFVDILVRLEKTGPANGGLGNGTPGDAITALAGLGGGGATDGAAGTMTPQDEEQELRNWTDFREHQLRFAQSGGFMN